MGKELILAEVYVSPSNNTILPPFTSKVGKTLLNNPTDGISISPLKTNGVYLIKYSNLSTFIEVEGDKVYSFEVGGEDEKVVKVLTELEEKVVFNTLWRIVDVKINKVKVELSDKFTLEIKTPALLVHPFIKEKKKVFTNSPSVLFFTNVLEITNLKRGDEKLKELLFTLDLSLWPEPSRIGYETVIYANKKVVGLVGVLNYTVLDNKELIRSILENAIARGIGSSRKNGFGRVRII